MEAPDGEYEQDGLRICVNAPPADLTWLREFIGPSVARSARTQGGQVVHVSLKRASGDLPPTGSAVSRQLAFALDAAPSFLPVLTSGHRTRLHDAEGGVVFDVSADGRDVMLLYHGSRSAARVRLMRVVREYLHNHALHAGRLVLHAAAVVQQGRALVIAGRKGAGKTTALIRMLARDGGAFLANDRVLVDLAPVPHARGVATVVAVRLDTLGLFPYLAARFRVDGDFRHHAGERRARGASAPVIAGDAVRLNAAQLCGALARPPVAAAPLGGVIFLDRREPASTRPRRLPRDAATRALTAALLGSCTGTCTSEVFVAGPATAPTWDELTSRCATLAAAVPCYVTRRLDDGVWAAFVAEPERPVPAGA